MTNGKKTINDILGGDNPPQGENQYVFGKPNPQEEWEEQIAPSSVEESTQEDSTQGDSAQKKVAERMKTAGVTPVGNPNAETEQTVGGNPTAEYVPGQFLEMFKKMNPYKPLTPEEAAAELKRQRRNRVFAALGDGLSAMHQAFSYAKGEQPMPSAMGGYTEKMRNRYERINKERLANDRAYMEGMMRAQQMDETARHNSELEKLRQQQQDRLDEETKIRREKADAYINYQNSLAAGNEAKAVYWKTKAELLEKGFSLDEAIKRATIAEKEAGARAKDAAAGASNSRTALNQQELKNKQNGYTTTSETTDQFGGTKKTKTVRTPNQGSGNGSTGTGNSKNNPYGSNSQKKDHKNNAFG